jgi:UDP-N-acetylmuramoylalanine--D-glutamate ligase
LGASGVAAAKLCVRLGAYVTGIDSKAHGELSEEARALASVGVRLGAGGHDVARMSEADVVVVSPGVPPLPEIAAAERRGIPVWSEIELATRSMEHSAPLVAIGGTNGKSTTTSLVGRLIGDSGRKVFVGGNLGEPLAGHVHDRWDAVVLEVSSFQLERVVRFHPHVCALLNVTEDHLDRYADFQEYANTKGNAFANQTGEDWAVVPTRDPICARQAGRGKGRVITFGPGGDIDVTEEHVVDHRTGDRFRLDEMALMGTHNALNVAAAIACVTPFGVAGEVVRSVLRTFAGLPHRTTFVAERDGIRFYDDSKGTNVGAAVSALEGLAETHAVLIAGGKDKGGSYDPLARALARKGRAAVLIGEAADAMARAIGDSVPVRRAESMADAVRMSMVLARPGDAVILSPACSSFDMFRDYNHRGEEFARAVRALCAEEDR